MTAPPRRERPLSRPFPPFDQLPLSAQLRRPRTRPLRPLHVDSRRSFKRLKCANCVEKLRLIEAPVADSLLLVRGDSAMMGERRVMQEALFYGFSLERHVPDDHLLRKIDRFLDLSEVRAHLGPTIATWGGPRSIPS
jgi:hypothetical protein